MKAKEKAYLVLADGSVYCGLAMGARGEAIGEVVFETGMVGCIETLTDPAYYGQIAVQTFPLVGNYGINAQDMESDKVHMKGYIVREWCEEPSNFRCEKTLDEFLKEQNTVGLCRIDTRSLAKRLREFGVVNGAITTTLDGKEELLKRINDYKVVGAVQSSTCSKIREYAGEDFCRTVAVCDYGVKRSAINALVNMKCKVLVFPAGTSAKDVLAHKPDGILLSSGGGDPCEYVDIIAQVKLLAESGVPILGVGLGHQLLALAMGGTVHKLKHGHRGSNQPVRVLETGKVSESPQNHGYAVDIGSLPDDVAQNTHVNVNDGTCEGIEYKKIPALSVQFDPDERIYEKLTSIKGCEQCR